MLHDRELDRLERPRKRRQAPLPRHHYKTWGHGNARVMIELVFRQNHRPERIEAVNRPH